MLVFAERPERQLRHVQLAERDRAGCGETGEPLCDGPHVGKCEITQYQAAGSGFYVVVTDGMPLQLIGRIRALAAAHDVELIAIGAPGGPGDAVNIEGYWDE